MYFIDLGKVELERLLQGSILNLPLDFFLNEVLWMCEAVEESSLHVLRP